MKKHPCLTNITHHNALRQSIIGIALLSAMPAMTLAYTYAMLWLNPIHMSKATQFIIFTTLVAQIAAGLIIILKYPINIIKLRKYIGNIAAGTLPERVTLLDTRSSDELQFIEQGLTIIINEMQLKIGDAKQQAKKERDLRETIERQHEFIYKNEQRRLMIESIATACLHLGKPLTIMDLRLHLIKLIDRIPKEEHNKIYDCEQILYEIMNILEKIDRIEKPKTNPCSDDYDDGSQLVA